MNLLHYFRINTKILGTVLVVLVLGGALALLGIFYLNQVNDRLNNLVNISTEKIRLAGQLNQDILEVVRAEKNYLLVTSAVDRGKYASDIDALITQVEARLRSLNLLVDADGRALLDDFAQHWQAYLALSRQVRQLADDGQVQEAAILSRTDARAAIDLTLANMRAIVDKNDADLDRDRQLNDTSYRQALAWMLSLSALALTVGIVLGVNVSRNIASNLGQMVHVADEISRGNVAHTLTIKSRDETGDLAIAFSRMIDYIREVADIANRIAGGDLEVQVTPRSEQDTLNLAIRQMVASLNHVTNENNRRIWQATGQTELTDQTRGQLDTTELGRRIITFLCRYLEAQIGALYLNNEGTLTLIGSYAYTRRKHLSDRFSVGEGIVGQAALEKQPILISNVPDDYIRVQSGLGDSSPRHLLAIPFLFNNEVSGVIELGGFQPWDDTNIAFLTGVMDYIGVVFNVALAYTRTQELLARTQQQAEELQVQTEELETQQEELRQSNEALEQQARLLRESEQELKTQQEELEVTNEELSEKTQLLEQERMAVEQQNRKLQAAQEDLEQQARELALASKYKSEFLSNMSHELRTPLNSMLILARMLADNEPGTLTDEQVESARIIYNSGQDLLALISDILDLAKVEAGKMELRPTAVPLEDLLTNLERDFRPLAQEEGLEWQMRLAEGLPKIIQTDRQRLLQILKNLLSNAFKFTGQGSVILTVDRPTAEIAMPAALEPAHAIAFSVTDTGIGIPPEEQQRIFEAFQQVDGTTSRKYGGTGLGLSISRSLAAFLGGQIQLRSEVGRGSSFTLVLPEKIPDIAEPKPAEVQPQSIQPVQLAPMPDLPDDIAETDQLLLIIEDDDRFAKILERMAERKGFHPVIAADGETGLQLAQRYHPVAILLDLNLPNMDGWHVLSAVKTNPGLRHIPVHIISAEDESPEAYRRGAIGFLTKPVAPEMLEQAFDRLESFLSHKLKTLLIIEDDAATRRGLKQLIGNGDVECLETDTAKEALKILKDRNVDCIILDLRLPDLSGFQLLDRLAEDETLHKPPIIVYTGQELTREQNEQIMKYADTIIVKGIKSEERLLDETALFLHRVIADLPPSKQQIIRYLYERDDILADKKILLVDDDVRSAFALSRLLSEKGLSVEIATSGQKALDILAAQPALDLALMDVMMPEMDGFETIRRIRAQRQFAQLPILALTAKVMPGDREKCLAAGANDYLPKPVDVDRLLSMLRVWLYR